MSASSRFRRINGNWVLDQRGGIAKKAEVATYEKMYKRIVSHDLRNVLSSHNQVHEELSLFSATPIGDVDNFNSSAMLRQIVFQFELSYFMQDVSRHGMSVEDPSMIPETGGKDESFCTNSGPSALHFGHTFIGPTHIFNNHYSIYFEVLGEDGTHYRLPFCSQEVTAMDDPYFAPHESEYSFVGAAKLKLRSWGNVMQITKRLDKVGGHALTRNVAGASKFYVECLRGTKGQLLTVEKCVVKSRQDIINEGTLKHV